MTNRAMVGRPGSVAFAKAALLVVTVMFLYRTAASAYRRLSDEPIDWDQLRPEWLAASIVFYWCALLCSFVYWRRILAALGQPTQVGNALYAFSVGHLGKYVPGKAMVVLLRVGLLTGRSVPPIPLATSVVVETMTMMSVGSLWAAILLAGKTSDYPLGSIGAVGFLLLATLPTLPQCFRLLVLTVARSPEQRRQLSEALPRLNYALLAQGWLLNLVGWVFMGMSLWAVMTALSPDGITPAPPPWHWVGWVGISVVAGFLSFLPGGIVVRDGVLVALLKDAFDPLRAIAAAVLLRVVWLVGELALAGVMHVATRRGTPSPRDRGEKQAGEHDIDCHSAAQ